MSFAAPSSNVVVVSSDPQAIASGSLSIAINFSKDALIGSLPLGGNYAMDIMDVASVEVDFDYVEQIGDITDYKINVPSLEFEILNGVENTDIGGKENLYGYLQGLGVADLIVAKMEFNSSFDYYYCTRNDVELDYENDRLKFRMFHPLKYGVIGFGRTFQTSDLSPKYVQLYYDDGAGTTATINEGVLVRDYIETYLGAVGSTTNLVYKSTVYPKKYTDSFSDNEKNFALYDLTTHDFTVATGIVRELALTEAAIVGNVLGYAFYVPRNDRTDFVTLDENNFESLNVDFNPRSIRYVSLAVTLGDDTTTSPYPYDYFLVQYTNNLVDSDGRNDITLTFGDTSYVTAVAFDTASSKFEFGNYQYGSLSTSFKDDLLDTYKRSLGVLPFGSKISGKIIGVDTLKPYQSIYMDSSVSMLGSAYYRPSYLKYDLMNDMIEFEAYTMFSP